MSLDLVFICFFGVIVQEISGQCISGILGNGRPLADTLGLGLYGATVPAVYSSAKPLTYDTYPAIPLASLGAPNRAVAVSSASPVAPKGLRFADNMLVEAPLAVNGKLPFLGSVGLDGQLPTIGLGKIAYRCGGNLGIINENYPALNVGYNQNALAPVNYAARAGNPAYYNPPSPGRFGYNIL